MYTIGEISKMFDLPVSTIRYYDQVGLFPNLKREGQIRQFSQKEIDTLYVINCLKQSGLEIKDIKQFIEWCQIGPSTYSQRQQLFETRKQELYKQKIELEKNIALLEYKCWFYNQLLHHTDEQTLRAMIPDQLPEDIKKKFYLSHPNLNKTTKI